MNCDETLGTVLPALLRRRPDAVRSGAVVQLVVPDDRECRWFYEFRGDSVVATRGVSTSSDVTISFVREDLARFLDDTIDFGHAIATKRVKVMGDASLLLALAAAVRA